MDNSFFTYLQQLEIMTFFAGYPLIYAAVVVIAGNSLKKNTVGNSALSVLPFAYALVGTLFLGFQLKKLYPDYSFENIRSTMQLPWLVLWGLLSILFWIPAIGKKRLLSLIHSLVFFFFLVKDLLIHLYASSGNSDMIKNDMNIYTTSLLLNLGAVILLILISFLHTQYKKTANS
ncbi:MAG TPA: hypothetical protein VFE53_12215 [Mucilaginibacter sp.]|jgi:hypothetical protein|nr:hypothetical protein [Mucilaginibacter sp.]